MMLRGEQTELQLLEFARRGVWNSESNSCTQSVFILETYSWYSVWIIIVEVLLYTHCNFKKLSRFIDWLKSLGIHCLHYVCVYLHKLASLKLVHQLIWTTLGQHFTSGMETLVVWIVWWFKWFLKGVWVGYFSWHARSSSGRAWNTANKQPKLRFHVRNRPCICSQQWSK